MITIMVDIIIDRWKILNQKYAYRLLNVARFGDVHERIRAAAALCSLNDLEGE